MDEQDDEIRKLDLDSLDKELLICNQALQQVDAVKIAVETQFGQHKIHILERLQRASDKCDEYLALTREEVAGELLKISKFLDIKSQQAQVNKVMAAIVAVHHLRLERFANRLCYVLNAMVIPAGKNQSIYDISFKVLTFPANAVEMKEVQAKYGTSAKSIVSAIRIMRQNAGNVKTGNASPCSTITDALRELSTWAATATRPSSGRNNATNQPPVLGRILRSSIKIEDLHPETFLCADRIEWMHMESFPSLLWDKVAVHLPNQHVARYTSQHMSFLASNYLYFCLEERAANAKSQKNASSFSAKAHQLQVPDIVSSTPLIVTLHQDIYCTGEAAPDGQRQSGTDVLYVAGYVGRHRQANRALSAFPDVIQVIVLLM